jgi:cytochrome c-type biogenesis protein CcmH
MIVFWVVAALLTAAVVAVLAGPLMRRGEQADMSGSDLAVYRDQLTELERDRARGLVDAAEAAARATEPQAPQAKPARMLTAVLAVAIPLGALVVYLSVGQPGLPAQPLASRQIAPDSDPAKILAEVEHVRSRLKPVKDDLDQWVMVAEAYSKLGRPREAVDSFRVATGLAPDDMSLKAALAENLIIADGGAVGAEARTIFQAMPADSPAGPEARFYLALADLQAGDAKAALKGWQSLLADSPADAGWIEPTRARIADVARSLGLDPAKETPAPKPPAPTPPNTGASAAVPDAAAISQMTPEQQQQMIQTMVASLAAKLEANPDNPAGWRQLARAYTVLGEDDKAQAALDRAAQAEAKGGAKGTP